jgi:large subunit ribosomal protein L21
MSYAVIRTGGKQYKVNEGDTVRVDLLSGKAGDKVKFDDVLVVGGGDAEAKLGKGKLSGVSVEGEIVGEVKGDKLVVFKFRRRKRSRKKNGHRQLYTAVKILKVNG